MRVLRQARMGCETSGARLLYQWVLKLRFGSSAITGESVMSKGGSGGSEKARGLGVIGLVAQVNHQAAVGVMGLPSSHRRQ